MKLIIFSAPSGAGKTTIVRHLLNTFPNLAFSVSATTRPRRAHEIDGHDYYFLSVEDFQQRLAHDEFAEYEEVYEGVYYGTFKSEIAKIHAQQRHVLFDIDVKGGLNLKKIYGKNALSVYVKVPSLEVLQDRLNKRNTESEEKRKERLARAAEEMKYENFFDVVLVNENLEETLAQATELVKNFMGNSL